MCTFTQTETQKHTAHTNMYIKDIHTHYTHILLACVIGCAVCARLCVLQTNNCNTQTYNRPYEFHTNKAENMPMTLAALLDLGSSRKRIKIDRNVSARMRCVCACMRVYLSRPHGTCTLDRHNPHACIEQIQIDTETEADTGAATQCHTTHHAYSLSRKRVLSYSLFHM